MLSSVANTKNSIKLCANKWLILNRIISISDIWNHLTGGGVQTNFLWFKNKVTYKLFPYKSLYI